MRIPPASLPWQQSAYCSCHAVRINTADTIAHIGREHEAQVEGSEGFSIS